MGPSSSAEPAETLSRVEIVVPSVGESVVEIRVAQWLKQDGEIVEEDEPVCTLETDKANVDVPAPVSGVLRIAVQEGETVEPGKILGYVEPAHPDSDSDSDSESPESPEPPTAPREEGSERKRVTPVAEKLMQERGISEEQVREALGLGEQVRIRKEDVLAAVQQLKEKEEEEKKPQEWKPQKPSGTSPHISVSQVHRRDIARAEDRAIRRIPLTPLRKALIRRLMSARHQTAMLTTFNEVDMSEIIRIRKTYGEEFRKVHGVKLGFMSFFIKACAFALLKYPQVNSQLDEEREEVIQFQYCDIGIAVATPRGLVVPVIRDAHRKSLAELEHEVDMYAHRARTGRIQPHELEGGTFTITNGGVFGSLLSTPLLNYPQTAILGMHRIQERPVAVNGKVEIRPMMYLALSYDHRLIDGQDAVTFLVFVKRLLENPIWLLYGEDPYRILLELDSAVE